MGSSNSLELLEVALHAQSPPILATAQGSVAPKFTSLCVQRESAWRSALKVIDASTQQHVFSFKLPSLSWRCILQTPDDRSLLTIKGINFSSGFRVFEQDQTENMSLEVQVEGFSHRVIYVDFIDRLSGRKCRVLMDCNYERVVIFYLEYGTPHLPPEPRRNDVTNRDRFQAVGRIRRPHTKAFAEEPQYVEAAPGVDITLLLLMWRAWHHLEERRQA